MGIRTYTHSTQTADGSGVINNTGDPSLNGLLLGIKIVQAASPAAGGDITISVGDGAASKTLLTLTNNNTAGPTWYYPRALVQDTAGADITGQYTLLPLNGRITVALAQGTAAQTLSVVVQYAE